MHKNCRLKELRKSCGLTQSQMAEYLGAGSDVVVRIEEDAEKPDATMVRKICDLFGCSIEYLFGENNDCVPVGFTFAVDKLNGEELDGVSRINRIARNLEDMGRLYKEA